GVIGYDLFNEPTALIPPGYFERGLVWPLYARLMADIDQVDSHHLFFIEGPYIADFAPSIRPLSAASRVVYSPHLYTGSQVAPLFPQDPAATPRRIFQQMGDASQVPAPAWWGELGIVMDKPYATAWAEAALDTFDDLQVGWAWWQWRQDWNWGVRDGDGDVVNQVFLGHLARPFVVATPRGVQARRGASGRGSLTLTVQTTHQDAPVVVSWPTLLPEPTVVGDCVERWTRAAQAARIELWLVPAQGCTVQVESIP
ncbi:MAG TPA: cellulase family glycosylhydrolase, partial [Chloroflexota bacterium]